MTAGPPDPKAYADVIRQALAVLAAQSDHALSSAQVSASLRDEHAIDVHWKTIEAALRRNPALTSRRTTSGRTTYRIMASGQAALAGNTGNVRVIDPSKAVEAVLGLQELLAAMRGTVRVCDPYFDEATVEHLDAVSKPAEVRVLTKNIRDEAALRRLTAAASQGRRFLVRRSRSALHDRYIIDDEKMWLLGSSLNGFAKTQSFVVLTGPDVRGLVLDVFDREWSLAQPWPA